MGALESRLWDDSTARGLLYTLAGTGASLAAGEVLRRVDRRVGRGVAGRAMAVYTAVAGRELGEAARKVASALGRDDLTAAQDLLPALVGRDPRALDAKGVAAAVIESVAENTVDAVVAPAFWGLVAGAPGALCYRAVNTMDSMVGHRSERYRRFGWAAARLDDAANYLPARLTALAVCSVRPGSAAQIARTISRAKAARLPEHSPNALVAECAFAAALGVRLGGPTRYADRVVVRPDLGEGRTPEVDDIERAVRLSEEVTGRCLAACLSLSVVELVRRRIPARTANPRPWR